MNQRDPYGPWGHPPPPQPTPSSPPLPKGHWDAMISAFLWSLGICAVLGAILVASTYGWTGARLFEGCAVGVGVGIGVGIVAACIAGAMQG